MEFWRNLKPVEKVFQPDALPEVYMANAATARFVPPARVHRIFVPGVALPDSV